MRAKEILKKESQFKGGRKDVDKKVEEMNEEERAVFNILEDEKQIDDGRYEEIDDDFILMLNGGVPAMELAEENKDNIAKNEAHDN